MATVLVTYELRAEYRENDPAAVKIWHMIRDAGHTALCGRVLTPDSETRSDVEWGTTHPLCHTCGALYLRQVP
ncbi:hypothetical protein [Streptomyces sp. SID3343]|uniref:hypothetical protein n=1 Tax=Streptomyces sp. SID3343 TaxID=2690260 RepID=UPI00136F9113|nr:hypothetical protein [Streptomyces sp. SID3343]